jgi:hypothetical protein
VERVKCMDVMWCGLCRAGGVELLEDAKYMGCRICRMCDRYGMFRMCTKCRICKCVESDEGVAVVEGMEGV